ncbi:MAG: hypothetical protein J2P46_08935, partial [Zavarzinella sp.]|nr:hypothetical protein [Zavarzinella sp.]
VHDRAWRVRGDDLFRLATPMELGLSPDDANRELLLLPAPADSEPRPDPTSFARTLFHAAVDREIDRAFADGRLDDAAVRSARRGLGPARWDAIRTVLEEENLIARSDPDHVVFREFVAFALEVVEFAPQEWHVYFPGVSPDEPPLCDVRRLLDVEAIRNATQPPMVANPPSPLPDSAAAGGGEVPARPPVTEDARRLAAGWSAHGNDLAAAIVLYQAGDADSALHLGRLLDRLRTLLDPPADQLGFWRATLNDLLPRAAAAGWPAERKLLYELQAACLAVERPTYAADLIEWAVTLGRRPIKRLLTKPKWLNATRHLRAACHCAESLSGATGSDMVHRLSDAVHLAENKARADLRPEIVAVLDDVGLVPQSVADRLAREKLIEELLDAACARGFLRIGDLRDAIARNRIKLPDLRGAGELVHGDPLIRADRGLAIRLDGVYRRGEVYMRLLQRTCSVCFATPVGRWLTKYVALPFGGAFLLLEAFHHMVEAGEDFLDWVTGWDDAVQGLSALAGAAAGYVADNPNPPRVVNWPVLLGLGVFLLLMIHWPTFRTRVARLATFAFVKVPRALRRSPVVRAIVFNPVTRFFRRYLLVPLVAGGLAGFATLRFSGDRASAGLVGSGVALLLGTFFRTPLGRMVEDRLDEAAERFWRVVSVNFVLGVLTLILHFFRAVFEAIDRGIYVVDEWLRLHEGQSRAVFVFKATFGAVWFVLTYLFRFAWNLLVEPQINPIKHFPVVTVSHKMLLPLIPSLAKQFGIGEGTMATIVFGIPGIFGFLVWELRENWKLYRANAPAGIRPVIVGSHGEKVRGLLRPGFHSGVVPKTFARLRRAVRARKARRAARYEHTLEHTAEALQRFADRDFAAYLRASRRWGGTAIEAARPELEPNRIRLPFRLAAGLDPAVVVLEERAGWVIGSVEDPGGLDRLTADQRAAFEDALVGLYKRAGVHVVREQVAAVLGPQAYGFDAVPEGLFIPLADGRERFCDYDDGPELESPGCELPTGEVVLTGRPLAWADWVDRWEADAAGKSPGGPLIAGWRFLPAAGGSPAPPRPDEEAADRHPDRV